MLVRVSDTRAIDDLRAYLKRRIDYIVSDERDSGTLGVGVVGSHADGGRLEVDLYLRAWQAAHPDVALEISDE